MKSSLLMLGRLALGGAAAATAIAAASPVPHFGFSTIGGRNQPRPGPDSTRVGLTLDAMGRIDPVLCEMLSDQIGNFWSSGEKFGVGRFADARTRIQNAKDSVSGNVKDLAAIRLLTARLASEDPCVRRTAAKMLGNSAVTDAALQRLLDDPAPRIREAALYAIGEGERPALQAPIEKLLTESSADVAAMAAYALGQLEDRESLPALIRALDARSARLRASAAWALGRIADKRAGEALSARLRDSDPEVRVMAAEAIGELEHLQAVPAGLADAAQSTDLMLRRAVASALANIADPATLKTLVALSADQDVEVRLVAVEGLGALGLIEALPALTKALDDADKGVRRAAAEALGEIEG